MRPSPLLAMRVTASSLMRPTDPLSSKYRKLRLTTKDVKKGFYRGNRTGSMGNHTRWGGYVIDWKKVRSYVVPSLKDFKLTPFVSKKIKPKYGDYSRVRDKMGPKSPKLYLWRWKEENGYG